MQTQNSVDGLKFETGDDASKICEGCVLGKMHRSPFPNDGRTRAKAVGELVHSDVGGPMQQPTPNGERYYVIFKDDFSEWTEVNLMKQKSEVEDLFVKFVVRMKTQTGRNVKILRSDNGGE